MATRRKEMVTHDTKEEIMHRCRTLHAMSGRTFGDYVENLSWKDIHKDPCLLVSIEGRKICVGIRKEML